MRIERIGRGVKGFYRLADYALRWGMIATSAQRRLRILGFRQRHGLAATQEAFAVSRRTLFAWRAKLHSEGGNLAALAPRSTAPKRRRTRQWPATITTEIRRLRTQHPNLFTHWHTYPKTPKMNAHCERFNRTIQEEFIDYHYDSLFEDDLTDFNLELLSWLSWYNLERPHFSLAQPVPGRKTPILLSPVQFLHENHQCNMYWPDTAV
jgi:transposase InsO family protein